MRSRRDRRRARDYQAQAKQQQHVIEQQRAEAEEQRRIEAALAEEQEAAKAACRAEGHGWALSADGTISCLRPRTTQPEPEPESAPDIPVVAPAPVENGRRPNLLLVGGAAALALLFVAR